jgi:hypothetical protein
MQKALLEPIRHLVDRHFLIKDAWQLLLKLWDVEIV